MEKSDGPENGRERAREPPPRPRTGAVPDLPETLAQNLVKGKMGGLWVDLGRLPGRADGLRARHVSPETQDSRATLTLNCGIARTLGGRRKNVHLKRGTAGLTAPSAHGPPSARLPSYAQAKRHTAELRPGEIPGLRTEPS